MKTFRGRDRHFDNILVRNGSKVIHIDFTYILGSGPALDAPPISFAVEMEKAFRSLGVWEIFENLCVAAFSSARRNSSELLRIASLAFARSGIMPQRVSTFLRSKNSLRMADDDQTAENYVLKKVRKGASHPKTWLKRIAHDVVDPAWYKLLEKGFPPAVLAVKVLNEVESYETKKLARDLKEAGDDVDDAERIEIDE